MPRQTIYIYDELGPEEWGLVSARQIAAELGDIKGDVLVRLNSPGGVINEAQAIAVHLEEHMSQGYDVEVQIDALAASAATFFLASASKRTIARDAYAMIHRPWTLAAGNASDLQQASERLEMFERTMVARYNRIMTDDEEAIIAAMDKETWYTAMEAKKAGLVDDIIDGPEMALSPNLGKVGKDFRNVPGVVAASARPTIRQTARESRARQRMTTGRTVQTLLNEVRAAQGTGRIVRV